MQALLVFVCALQLWPAVLAGPHSQQFVLRRNGQSQLMEVQNFKWANCGPSSNPSVVRSLIIMPDPIAIPGEVAIGVVASTTIALQSPLKVEVVLEKKLGEMWLKLPCVDNIGSCTYPDGCAVLDSIIPPGRPCPEPLYSYGIPCHCPFKAGTYSLPTSSVYVPNMDLPSFLTNGEYRARVVLSMGDQQMGCLWMAFSLKSPSQVFW